MKCNSLPALSQLCSLQLAQIIKNGEEWPYKTFIPAHIGDEVFKALSEICVMKEEILRRFAETTLDITKFYAYSMITSPALTVLKKYDHLVSLRFVEQSDEYSDDPYYPQDVNYVYISKLVEQNLSKEAANSLRQLEITGFNIISFFGLHLLPNLEILSVREFENENVEGVVDSKLRSLDISEISVKDFSWLPKLVNLEVLILHDVEIDNRPGCLHELTSLSKLRYLDVSTSDDDDSFSLFVFNTLLTAETSPWPELSCLDMGGANFSEYSEEEAVEGIRQIVKKNPQMRIIALVESLLSSYKFDMEEVQVFNCYSNKSTLQALNYYLKLGIALRKYIVNDFLSKILRNRNNLDTEDLCQVVELICCALKKYLYCFDTVTECLSPLKVLSSAIIERVPDRLRQKCVNCCLMIENRDVCVWNSLVSLGALSLDHIDHYQLLHLALAEANNWNFLASFSNLLAIISFLTRINGPARKVADIVSSSLKALWTQAEDVSMDLCFERLQKTLGNVDVEERELARISTGYSVAELNRMTPEIKKLLRAIHVCLAGDQHDCEEGAYYFCFQRYYAYTGILSVLLTYGQLDERTNTMINSHLQNAISKWNMSSTANLCAPFRSFIVFERIMEMTKFDGARLWCVRGLLHVFSRDSPVDRHLNYPEMLKRSPLLESFKALYQNESKDSHIGTSLQSKDGVHFRNVIRLIDSHPIGSSSEPVDDSYILYLVNILKDQNSGAAILKLALISLWSFADGSPKISRIICSANGLEILHELLRKYAKSVEMERTILAVLSCLCEVEELADPMIKDGEFIDRIRNCWNRKCFIEHDNTDQIERCYFLAGILSNLLTYGLEDKTLEDQTDDLIQNMVKHRSPPSVSTAIGVVQTFEVLERIMDRTRHDGPRLWCLWSLLSVLQNKAVTLLRDYSEMLKKSSLLDKLPAIQDRYEKHTRMHKMAKEILELVPE